jgi:rifampicin phosphotransferase
VSITEQKTAEAAGWEPPGPGPWTQDSAHAPVASTLVMQEIYPEGFNRGFTETFARYGLLLDRLAMGVVNGFTYHQPQPFDMPGPDGPMPPEQIGAEIGRRAALAQEAFDTKLWRQDLALWDESCKPAAVARHRELADVVLTDLSDEQLTAHLHEVAAHLTAMVYQHHRFNVAALLPVGDLAIHVTRWTGRPPSDALRVLDGYSPVSGMAPPEMTDALDALRDDPDAQAMLEGPGDPGARLEQLRAAHRALDEYVRSVDYRIIDGFDVVAPTLREQPGMILGKLAAGLVADPDAARRRADVTADELRDSVPAEHRQAFDELVEEARAVYRLRDERGLYSDMGALGLLRLAMLEAGRRSLERGHLLERHHILEATVDEVVATLRGEGPGAEELAHRNEERQALNALGAPRHLGPPPPPMPSLDGLPPALQRVMSAVGFAIDGVLGQMEEPGGDASVVIGIPANGGVVEGVARRIARIDDLLDLEDGEIVIAASTGEAFNAVLHLVGGIVTDHGSHACHAAIVAREMGFPCVVGSVNATRRISTGDRIRLDGSKGEVTIL